MKSIPIYYLANTYVVLRAIKNEEATVVAGSTQTQKPAEPDIDQLVARIENSN